MIKKEPTRSTMISSPPIFEGSEGLEWLKVGKV